MYISAWKKVENSFLIEETALMVVHFAPANFKRIYKLLNFPFDVCLFGATPLS